MLFPTNYNHHSNSSHIYQYYSFNMTSRSQLFPPKLVGLSSLFSADLIEECGTALIKCQIRDVLEKSSSKALDVGIADEITPFLKAVYDHEQLCAVQLHTVPRMLKKVLESHSRNYVLQIFTILQSLGQRRIEGTYFSNQNQTIRR